MTLFLIALAVLVGIAVALQSQFMGTMNRTAGTAATILITYGVGGALAVLFWLARGRPLAGMRQIPWYGWTAGAFGLLIVGGVGFAAPRLGLSRTLVITVAAQLLAAVLIDHFGLFGAEQRAIDIVRAVGLGVTVLGVWLVVKS
jgi:transporter family-2 protein